MAVTVEGESNDVSGNAFTLVTALAVDVSLKEMQRLISELYAAKLPLAIPVTCTGDVYRWIVEDDQDASWQLCDRVPNFSGNALLDSKDVAAILASQDYGFSIREFHWCIGGPVDGFSKSSHRLVPDEPISCLMLDVVTLGTASTVCRTSVPAPTAISTPAVSTKPTLFQTTLSKGLEEWLMVKSDWSETTKVAAKGAVGNLITIVGDISPADVTPSDFARFASLHTKLPGDYFSRPKKYEGKTIDQVVENAKRCAAKGFSERTRANKLDWLNRFFSYLESKGYIAMNVAGGLAPKVSSSAEKDARAPFSDDDIQKIFGTQGLSLIAKYIEREGKQIAFWGPLIALFTGARAQEIALLSVENVLSLGDVGWALSITDENSNESASQRLKTSASKRVVPIHDSLEEVGFLDFVEMRRKTGSNSLLFPEVEEYSSIHQRHRAMTNWFNGSFLKKIGVKTDKKSFHSFRHAVIQKFFGDARLAYKAHQFTGHGSFVPESMKQSVQVNTYGRPFNEEELKELLPLLDYGLSIPEMKIVAAELLKSAT